MALPVLDGNQSATTLSSVVTGGEHIVAHSVVSLGSAAIANITSAVSGSVVSISNFPSTQTVAGTVTANVDQASLISSIEGYAESYTSQFPVGIDQTGFGNVPISGTVTANVGGIASGVTIPVRLFAEKESEAPSGQDTLVLCDAAGQLLVNAKSGGASVLGYDGNAFVSVKQVAGSSVTIGSLPAISGTVTANVLGYSDNEASYQPIPVVPWDENVSSGRAVVVKVQQEGMPLLEISGTVTAAAPNGSLTTRFGTPTTANTAFATTAVTNTSRRYLLIQNVTTGSNVITVGIGFTPTTTQGIQLTAGAGITFESSYIPTGAVYVLSGVTASNFTILEA